MKTVDRALALEEARSVRIGLEAVKEVAERSFDVPLQRLAVMAQHLAVGRFEASESQTVAKAGRLPRLSLFCWHFLHFPVSTHDAFSRPIAGQAGEQPMGGLRARYLQPAGKVA
ncbi:hypothetical protein HV823_06740 [Rhizobium sp. DBTS2]|uniref:Uncharacterized protein n=1 Tax=Mycoplana rhizolycopersici TaxID=2746702 RepID=A0ABX2QF10_9HYPH|nr:hypothetical protein [Rhizobium rhizolycopersici]